MSLILPCGTVTALEGLAVMLSSTAICTALGIAAATLESKSIEDTTRWGHWGTTIGVVFGVPLTICAFVLMTRGS